MANRTIQFLGQGYGSTPCTIAATVDGVSVYSGSVPTKTGDVDRTPENQVVLFGFELPLEFTGTKSVSWTVTGTSLYFGHAQANYIPVWNPIYSADELATLISTSATKSEKLAIYQSKAPDLTAEEIALLESTGPATKDARKAVYPNHGIQLQLSGGADTWGSPALTNGVISNVSINGSPQIVSDPGEAVGMWGYEVATADGQTSTITFDLTVTPGR